MRLQITFVVTKMSPDEGIRVIGNATQLLQQSLPTDQFRRLEVKIGTPLPPHVRPRSKTLSVIYEKELDLSRDTLEKAVKSLYNIAVQFLHPEDLKSK